MSQHIVFIGAGSMAEALIKGLLDQQIVSTKNITVCNRGNEQRLQYLREQYFVQACPVHSGTFALALETADIIVLAMKPKDAAEALKQLEPLLKSHHTLVSVIAGLTMATIRQLIIKPLAIIRTMPNTSSTIGRGATGIAFSTEVSDSQKQFSLEMFSSIGVTAVVEESMLDVVTGISGSGPAYIYYMMEAMIRAGEQLGLDKATAQALTVETVIGAGEMVKRTGELPEILRAKVTSPNGTTQAAIETLTDGMFQATVEAAVNRASQRAAELGQMITEMIKK
jgi:pyrroline-5-carboxylate reductase